MKNSLVILLTLFCVSVAHAQYSTREVSKKMQTYTDSLKNVEYDYMFPILGDKAYKLGFDVPYPIGFGLNQLLTKNSIVIDNIKIGFETPKRNIDPIDMSEFIEFGETTAEIYNVNVRPDVWLFPFLNVYGIFGYTPYAKTSVELVKPIELESAPLQTGYTYGGGVTGAFGVGPLFLVLDGNWTWSNMELVKDPVRTSGFGVRLGHNIVNKKKPHKSLAVWAGAMRLRLQTDTKGSIRLGDAIDGDDTAVKETLQTASDKLGEIHDELPGFPAFDELRGKITNTIEAIDYVIAESPVQNTVISYELDKKLEQNWAALIGASYQFNKNWMLRYETQFARTRAMHLVMVNYRFLGLKKIKKVTE